MNALAKNEGGLDRTLRIIVGVGLMSLAVRGISPWGYVGILLILTGLIGWCPLYRLLGISTNHETPRQSGTQQKT